MSCCDKLINDDVSIYSDDSTESNHSIEDIFFACNNKIIPVTVDNIYPLESNNQTINMAALFNYLDEKDETNFTNVYLPEKNMSYNEISNLFFSNFGKYFSSQILNQYWNEIKGLSLLNIFSKTFENINNVNYDNLSSKIKIKLYKECSFSKITTKAYKIFALNLEEFQNSLKSIEPRLDGSLCASTIFHLYSDVLNVGIKITQKFIINNIPDHLKKSVNNDNLIIFSANR